MLDHEQNKDTLIVRQNYQSRKKPYLNFTDTH